MDGLECSEIMYSQLNTELRFDAEYFSKTSLKLLETIKSKPYDLIGNVGVVTDGIHTSIDYDEESGINLLSATSPRQNTFNLTRKAYISKKAHLANPRTALHENDVILSTVGTVGNCAVVDETILPANADRHVAIIRLKSKIDPYVLSTFLLTKYGTNQTVREATGNVQLNLFLYKIREIMVPIFGKDFQNQIRSTVRNALSLLREAEAMYSNVEQLLEKEIDISPSSVPNSGVSVKSFSESFGNTGRLDAEYYQPKYDALVNAIKAVPHDSLENIVTISKSIEPGSDSYRNEGIPFVRISDLTKYEISETDKYIERGGEFDNASLYLKKDEILFSKDGSVGIAYKVEQDEAKITSSALLHLTINDTKKILPDYLTAVLNSEIVQLQAERDAGGSIIKHWKPSEIDEVLIPILDIAIQEQISKQILESFSLRRKSKELLECAKLAAEMAVEKDEATAISWLEDKIRTI